MKTEAQVEMLSAYLDGELRPDEKARVEALLERDPGARQQLEGMRSMVSGLGSLERLAPPPTLGQDVTRRIALQGERRSLLDRVEDGLSGLQGQSNIFLMFALIFSLAAITFLFVQGLERSRDGLLPVTSGGAAVQDDPEAEDALRRQIATASSVVIAGHLFQRMEDGLWVEDGLGAEEIAAARPIDLARQPAWLEERPRLRGVAMLGRCVLRYEGEILELRSGPGSPASAPRDSADE
ncbi:MAG: zf-HC2 domain-containing protein [Acidobacteriota bacterium]